MTAELNKSPPQDLSLPWENETASWIYLGPERLSERGVCVITAPIVDDELEIIAYVPSLDHADFIVRACNSHYELLNALENVLIASEDNGDIDDIDWNGIRSAIAKARAQP